ncbi:MAG: regulatory protein RecX [Eubacteriales bacterium]
MQITKVVKLSKARSKVYLNDEFAFVLYKGELRRFEIEEGKEISVEDYEEISNVIIPRRAKLRCMNLLMKKDYTQFKLHEKLRNDYKDSDIEEAIAYLKSYGYLDDKRYATDYVAYHMERKSRMQMESDLYKRGIEKDLIQEALSTSIVDYENQEIELIQKWLLKKRYAQEAATIVETQKLIRFLLCKGFSISNIKKVIYHTDFLEET